MKDVQSPAVAMQVAVGDTGRVPDTLDSLVRRYHAQLLRFLSARLKSDQEAADLAQETYVRLMRYSPARTPDELRHTLFHIARNLLIDHWRWRRFRGPTTQVSIDGLDLESDGADPERELLGEQLLMRLEDVILAMPERRRTVFLLSRIEGLSNPEVARRCGISVKTVEKHIAIALEQCRREVGDDALESF